MLALLYPCTGAQIVWSWLSFRFVIAVFAVMMMNSSLALKYNNEKVEKSEFNRGMALRCETDARLLQRL